MKKILTIMIMSLLILAVPIMGQADGEDVINAGTTPDKAFYFIDIAMENLGLALTFDKDKKIEKEFNIAEERLSEIKEMGLEGNVEAMAKAEKKHEAVMTKLKGEVANVEDSDSEGELKKELELEMKIKDHINRLDDVKNEIEINIKIKGDLTPEQLALIDELIASLEGQANEVEIEIKNEKDKTKIKIEQESNKDAEELEAEFEDELGITLELQEDALEEIAEVGEDLAELVAENPELDVTTINNPLTQAQTAFDAGEFEQAENLADEADELLDENEDSEYEAEDFAENDDGTDDENETDSDNESNDSDNEAEDNEDENETDDDENDSDDDENDSDEEEDEDQE